MDLFIDLWMDFFEVSGTILVARNRERLFRRQMLTLEYGVCLKAYSICLSTSVPCVMSVSVRPSSVHGGRRSCPPVASFRGWGRDFIHPQRYLGTWF